MARTYRPKTALNRLEYSPDVNPLLEPREITLKRRRVRTGSTRDLVDPSTGEISGVSAVYTIEEKDDAEFVKIFADGVKAAFGLTQTGARVFQAVLDAYQRAAIKGGYAEAVELFWFNDGLCGRDIGMSEDTYKRGLRELLDKEFLAPRLSSSFWVNPSLFFKGDRVRFIKEYVRKRSTADQQKREAIENQKELELGK